MNSFDWYKSLDLQQRINLKDLCVTITGVGFADLGKLFGFKERIDILYNKLKYEGFDV